MLRNPIFLRFFRGFRTPCPPPPLDSPMSLISPFSIRYLESTVVKLAPCEIPLFQLFSTTEPASASSGQPRMARTHGDRFSRPYNTGISRRYDMGKTIFQLLSTTEPASASSGQPRMVRTHEDRFSRPYYTGISRRYDMGKTIFSRFQLWFRTVLPFDAAK